MAEESAQEKKYYDIEAVMTEKYRKIPGFDQMAAGFHSRYAGFYVANRLLEGSEFTFMDLDT